MNYKKQKPESNLSSVRGAEVPQPPDGLVAAAEPSGMASILSGNARTRSLRAASSSVESPLTCNSNIIHKIILDQREKILSRNFPQMFGTTNFRTQLVCSYLSEHSVSSVLTSVMEQIFPGYYNSIQTVKNYSN